MTRIGQRVARAFALLALGVVVAGVAAQVRVPTARAACDGGITYVEAVTEAHAAVVGRVIEIRQSGMFVYVSAVRVERAVGIGTGPVFRRDVVPGLCGSDWPTLGTRVMVLLEVANAVPGGPSLDLFYAVGRTVTTGQATRIALDLPNTATIPASDWGSGLPLLTWGLPALAGVVWCVLFLTRSPRRSRPARR